MVIKTKVRKIGNSSGIIINSAILDHLDVKIGDTLDISLNKEFVILKKSSKKVTK